MTDSYVTSYQSMLNDDDEAFGGEILTSTKLTVSWPHDTLSGDNGTETYA